MNDQIIDSQRSGLVALDYVAVLAYLAVTAAIVLWSWRRQASIEDFFLGGRRMPWLAVGLSLMATLMSTISYLGAPGEMIKHGVTMFCGYLTLPLSIGVVLYVLIPFFMRLRLTSAYEYLDSRFGVAARLTAGLLFLMLRLGWMSLVVYTASLALQQMAGFQSLNTVVITVGIAATAYTCTGGFRAVIWTDVLQSVMLFGGTFMILIFVMWTTGTGPAHWWAIATANSPRHTSPPIFSLDVTVRMTIVTAMVNMFFWTVCTSAADQVVLQRFFSTSSVQSARRSYVVNTIADVLVGSLLALSGLALLSFYVEHPRLLPEGMSPVDSADKMMPHFFAHQLPAGLGGLILASFLCDAMQTLSSGVNSIGAVATKDVFERLFPAGWMPLGELALARVLTVLVGLLVTALALMVGYGVEHSGRTIIDLMPRSYNLFLGPLAALFFIGMFLPRCTSRSALPAVFVALVTSVVWSYWRELFHTSYEPTITLATAVPCLTGLAAAGALSFVVEKGGDHPGRAYTWLAVMRRPLDIVQHPQGQPLQASAESDTHGPGKPVAAGDSASLPIGLN